MNRTIFAAGVVSAGILFFSSGANAAGIKEGNWSMTTNIHVDGMDEEMAQANKDMENMSPEEKAMMEKMMGGMKMKMGGQGGGISMTRTQCITNNDPIPQGDDQENCQQTHSMSGHTVNFEVTCPDSHSTGQVTYKNDSMKGTIQSTTTKNGKEENATIDISGQYVGPCDRSGASSAPGMSDKEFALKQKELDLDPTANKGKTKPTAQSAVNDVNNAVNTTNNAKNAFNGLRSILGR